MKTGQRSTEITMNGTFCVSQCFEICVQFSNMIPCCLKSEENETMITNSSALNLRESIRLHHVYSSILVYFRFCEVHFPLERTIHESEHTLYETFVNDVQHCAIVFERWKPKHNEFCPSPRFDSIRSVLLDRPKCCNCSSIDRCVDSVPSIRQFAVWRRSFDLFAQRIPHRIWCLIKF